MRMLVATGMSAAQSSITHSYSVTVPCLREMRSDARNIQSAHCRPQCRVQQVGVRFKGGSPTGKVRESSCQACCKKRIAREHCSMGEPAIRKNCHLLNFGLQDDGHDHAVDSSRFAENHTASGISRLECESAAAEGCYDN
jgi:hypothetical protein